MIIEPFSLGKLNKIETENPIAIWKRSWCSQKALPPVRFHRVYFLQFSELRCEDIDFGVDFVAGNSNKLQKLGFGRKNQWSISF